MNSADLSSYWEYTSPQKEQGSHDHQYVMSLVILSVYAFA
jgi:hypothetical protein